MTVQTRSPTISVVVPTYREAENIPHLVREVDAILSNKGWSYNVVIVDDNSGDGSEEVCAELARRYPLKLVVRRNARGLATAVLRGIEESDSEYIVVMDADLSHPPGAIPEMISRLATDDADFVVGSRYVAGGSIHENWNWIRRLNSLIPSVLVKPLTRLKDPMSGFFALRRADMPPLQRLSPLGYKIGLELIVRGEFRRPAEVPIHFGERQYGQSKLGPREQLLFLRHLRRLFQYKFPFFSEFVQFGIVGASGFAIDLLFYLGLQTLVGIDHKTARAWSFLAAASWNWAANRVITFSRRVKTSKLLQWPAFLLTASIGFVINWGSYVILTGYVPFFDRHRVLALAIGVAIGMGFNFMGSHLFVFRRMIEEIDEDRRLLSSDVDDRPRIGESTAVMEQPPLNRD